VKQFGMSSEAAAGTIRLQRPAAHAQKSATIGSRSLHGGPSDKRADGDVDTAAPDAGSSTGVSGRVRLARSGADRVFGTGAGCRFGSDSVWCVLLVVR
jgi:hypothetical protein